MIERIRSWPRWVQYGLLSGISSFLIMLGRFTDTTFFQIITFGPIAPVVLITVWAGADYPSELSMLTVVVGFWSLFGALLGLITRKLGLAALIWLAAQILGGLLLLLYVAPLFY